MAMHEKLQIVRVMLPPDEQKISKTRSIVVLCQNPASITDDHGTYHTFKFHVFRKLQNLRPPTAEPFSSTKYELARGAFELPFNPLNFYQQLTKLPHDSNHQVEIYLIQSTPSATATATKKTTSRSPKKEEVYIRAPTIGTTFKKALEPTTTIGELMETIAPLLNKKSLFRRSRDVITHFTLGRTTQEKLALDDIVLDVFNTPHPNPDSSKNKKKLLILSLAPIGPLKLSEEKTKASTSSSSSSSSSSSLPHSSSSLSASVSSVSSVSSASTTVSSASSSTSRPSPKPVPPMQRAHTTSLLPPVASDIFLKSVAIASSPSLVKHAPKDVLASGVPLPALPTSTNKRIQTQSPPPKKKNLTIDTPSSSSSDSSSDSPDYSSKIHPGLKNQAQQPRSPKSPTDPAKARRRATFHVKAEPAKVDAAAVIEYHENIITELRAKIEARKRRIELKAAKDKEENAQNVEAYRKAERERMEVELAALEAEENELKREEQELEAHKRSTDTDLKAKFDTIFAGKSLDLDIDDDDDDVEIEKPIKPYEQKKVVNGILSKPTVSSPPSQKTTIISEEDEDLERDGAVLSLDDEEAMIAAEEAELQALEERLRSGTNARRPSLPY